MDTGKVYFDSEGNECSIWQVVKREPTWAAVRIQEGEKAIDEITILRQQLAKSEARAAQMHEAAHELYAWCVENLTAEQIKEGLPAGHKIGQLLEFEQPAVESFIARKQADEAERAGGEQ